ncbi:hypothetical protein EAF04_002690 [Stromatinia cepivora]|nr:hypothetical protein EAF04_002690 [Stromatinia cepivora]
MCNTYTIILNCNHKQTYTHRCPSYLGNPRQKCVKTPPTIAHYLADCRKCRGKERDNFVVVWVEKESDSSAVDEEEGNRNYMLGIGGFDIVANGEKRGREKGVRVYQDGTEEARREKKGVRNVSPNVSATDMARFDAEVEDDMYSQTNENTQDTSPDAPRTRSLPIKGKSKKPNVFGSLRKMIVRPKSEQDTAATGEHKPPTHGIVKQRLNRFNTIAGGFRGGKKTEDSEEHNSLSGSTDERRIDDATGYEYLTPKEFLDLHFKGVVASTGGAQITSSSATSAPIDIPQKSRPKASQEWTAQRHAGEYMSEIGGNPFTAKSAVVDSFTDDSEIPDVADSYHGVTSERWGNDTNSRPGRISRETEFSQSDEERMDIISQASDGETINITPHNIDNVLAVWKGSFGTSSSSSPIRIPSRPHALDHPVHSHSIDALSVPPHLRSQELDVAGHSTSLPNHHGVGERVARAQWAQGNDFEKVSSAPFAALQHAIDFVEPQMYRDIPKRNNTTKEPPRGFALPKRTNTGAIPHPRHPLANEITRSNTLTKTSQAQTRNQVTSPEIPEPVQETIAGTRYSSLTSPPTISPSPRIKDNEQGRQSPRLWNRKATPTSKPEYPTNLLVQGRASPAIDRSSIMTTFSQFIPSRNGELDEEITTGVLPAKTSTRTPRHRTGSRNTQNRTRGDAIPIPEVPAIPKTYAKHTTVLPKIGRDATGRFSVEYIEREQAGSAVSSLHKRVAREVNVEETEDIYANHTIGTWDAVLRIGAGDVSPVSSVEDLNGIGSPVSSFGERGDGRDWDDDGDEDGDEDGDGDVYLGPESYQENPDFISQPTNLSISSPPHLPSTFSPPHQVPTPTFTSILPQFPHTPPLSDPSPRSPLLSQNLQPQHQPQHQPQPQHQQSSHTIPQEIPTNTISPSPIDPTIPITLPLKIYKKNQQLALVIDGIDKVGGIENEIRRRQRGGMEQTEKGMGEGLRRADERLRDGRGL